VEKFSSEGVYTTNLLQVRDYRNPKCAENDHSSIKMRWHEIQESKLKFIQYNEDPRRCAYINQDVAESWIRSQALGVNPYNETINSRLDNGKITKILKRNKRLIDITKALFETLKDLLQASEFALYLFEKNGVLLLHEGDNLQTALDKDSLTGLIWNEKTIGTCAHILSMQLKRPVHLLGPEHYCLTFYNSSASAAPILDDNGDVIAILVLSQHLNKLPMDCFINFSSHMHVLALTTALATAIENNLQLKKSYDYLETANNHLKTTHYILNATLAVIDEGIISIDRNGNIIHINKESGRILQLGLGEIENRNINEFLTSQSRLMKLVLLGENVEVGETICNGNDEQQYIVNIRPVLNASSDEVDGAVLKLSSVEKVNAILPSRYGMVAGCKFEDLIGESKSFKRAVELGKRFAGSAENILLIGESGTGKELFAQAIHNRYRPQGPFMAINCAAVPKDLIESELFGYEGGSFTGAERSGRPGKFELAHGGTLLLDEIGDMPVELQAVLLRVLEDKQVMRIGGRRYKKVDFRVIAATNKDLYQLVKENLFREDLYFRLAVLSINLPPLRQREYDVEVLSRYFIKKYCKKLGCKSLQISASAMKVLGCYNWPGNVRQLENAVIYAVNNNGQGDIIEPGDLPDIVLNGKFTISDSGKKLEEIYNIETMERVIIENALYKTRNNITRAAELVGMGKSTLYRKLKEYNISIDD